ncbi:phosphoribosylformylglycinamidine synthase subunit PurQ [Thermosynechococcus sp. HN-54]|uniref:phosphoribosylformylglycinamidine synthase subunit PurQ n=1 Tax=Thermosynechococcus sp. HN-54 TaxID=2933959 RepID=UPI00202CF4A6|nr:phosphoribosylformylglycinamidine synthase subunit PurQ [Thermosynechococcus sp. HN-54]URR34547.1 phosphoribosylformylglycinamidine synthase subunit PurQ [Thermosynechococcus sp. HN-54]
MSHALKVGIVVFPGSNCDRDVAYVTSELLGWPTELLWHEETNLANYDLIVLPGGFSFGDYLRCGAIARFSPIMAAVKDHAAAGKWVLGICNGFQILTEAKLLPGALVRNRDLHFICDRVHLRLEAKERPWLQGYGEKTVIRLPIAHGEGCYYADAATLAELEANRQVLFRYADAQGNVTPESNPNGSLNNIAGICNAAGNVLGMMPHPERAADPALCHSPSDHTLDGLQLFKSLLMAAAEV